MEEAKKSTKEAKASSLEFSRFLSTTPSGLLPLPPNIKYHCFLSYKQSDAIHLVKAQSLIFLQLGYKCWYDQQFSEDISVDAMLEGVRQAMCYILFLTRDVFKSNAVLKEASKAIELKKPIILLSHPQTGMYGYCQFEHYRTSAPRNMKHLFDDIEAIQLQTRYFLEEAVTRRIDKKLKLILNQQQST